MLIGIWLTLDCNLKCRYCYESDKKSSLYMNKHTADNIVEYIEQNYTNNNEHLICQFHGGEPLLNYELMQYIIEKIEAVFSNSTKNIMMGMTTNGILLTNDKVKFLAKKMSYGLSISIDGEKKSHDKMRVFQNGQGSYDLVLEKAKMALEIMPDIRARLTFDSTTVENLFCNIKHLVEIGFKQIVCIPDYFDCKWNEEKIKTYVEELIETRKYYMRESLFKRGVDIPIIDNNIFKKTTCTGGINSMHIAPDGKIYPCSYVVDNKAYVIGSILDQEINQVDLDNINSVNKCDIAICEGCNNYQNCIAVRCKYLNKIITGNSLQPVPVICELENANIQFSKLNW